MAYISALELFSVGVGPSSSHTVGPMRAAATFVSTLSQRGLLTRVSSIRVALCGSLGATGVGHGTPDAVVAGLRGLDPRTCDVEEVPGAWQALGEGRAVALVGGREVTMAQRDIRLAPLTRLPGHPNGMRFTALAGEDVLLEEIAYSIGGGFVVWDDELPADGDTDLITALSEGRDSLNAEPTPHAESTPVDSAPADSAPPTDSARDFNSADELLALCQQTGRDIAEIAWECEVALRPEREVGAGLDAIWSAMVSCIEAGLHREGNLPGSLGVRRRAATQRSRLESLEDAARRGDGVGDLSIEWLQAYAMAVNEENAGGGRVVTAPTNGAAGIIPAVGRHFLRTHPALVLDADAARRAMRRFLLVAGAIGNLYKRNASISGAEAGCQGEVGSACSMAAGALCAVLGGTPQQVENAAEIAMEHNLGLTCDPVGGLVQVPCIERNAIAACTAVSAARLALQGDGSHVVSLDTVIETMRQTGLDMSTKYKETSTGGLAVNVIEC